MGVTARRKGRCNHREGHFRGFDVELEIEHLIIPAQPATDRLSVGEVIAQRLADHILSDGPAIWLRTSSSTESLDFGELSVGTLVSGNQIGTLIADALHGGPTKGPIPPRLPGDGAAPERRHGGT